MDMELIDAMPVAVAIHDDESIHYANKSARSLFGATDEQNIVGLRLSDLVHPDGHEAGRVRRGLLLEQRHALRGVAVKLMGLDGAVIYATVDAVPIEYKSSPMIMVVFTDVSDSSPTLPPL